MNPMDRLAELIEDWAFLIKRDGTRSSLPLIGLEVANLPYRQLHFLIIARSLTEPLPDLPPKIALEIRPFERADLEWVRKIDRPSEARACRQRLERDHKGFFAFYQGQPAGYAWASTEVDPSLERVPLELASDEVLFVDAFTHPAFRGKGVQTSLTLARLSLFQDLGYRRAIAYIEKHNAPSLAVWRKVGGQTTGAIDFTRIGPWYRVIFT